MSTLESKIATIELSTKRARSEHLAAGSNFSTDYTRQDAAILNVLRACEAASSLANMMVRNERIGVPGNNRDSFKLLEREGIITSELASALEAMIGFRNIAVHQYQKLNLAIVESVITKDLNDLLEFAEVARARLNNQ